MLLLLEWFSLRVLVLISLLPLLRSQVGLSVFSSKSIGSLLLLLRELGSSMFGCLELPFLWAVVVDLMRLV